MAVSIAQYVDLLFKKLQGVAKTANSTVKSASNESIASPAFLRGDVVWMQADQIPATAQTVGNITLALTGTSSIQCAPDTTVPPVGGIRPTWLTGETYWIPQEFGASWLPKVYVGPSGAANIEATGTQIFSAGISGVGEYYFDTQAGVLNFIGETIPSVLTAGNVIYVAGYQYVGDLGVTNIPSGANIGGLQVNGNTITAITGNVINFGNAISVAGNVTATNFIGNISGNIDAAGNITEVQFNDTGDLLGASAGFTFDKTSNLLTVSGNVSTGNVLVGNIVIPTTGNINVANTWINNLTDPTQAQDAATKNYVDNAIPIISNQTINPDGLTATYTLDQSAVDVGVLVTVNGVTQTPTTNYTIVGDQITLGYIPDQTDIIQVRFLAGAAVGNVVGATNKIYNGNSYANIASANGNIVLSAAGSNWTFDITGSLALPGGSRLRPLGPNLDIFAGTGSYVNLITSDESSYMGVGGAGGYVVTAGGTWDFNTNGNLTAPGNISTTGNVSAGNLSLSGNIAGNISFTGTDITINNAPGGQEGGELKWALPAPANTVLSTSLTQDVFQNGMRFFESGGNTRGLYMDLGNAPNGTSTAVGYRDIPQVSFTGNTTIATTDAGRHYYSTLSTGNVLTIANNASQGFQVGAAITIINQGTGNITVAQGSGVTLYLAGNATAGNRTVSTFGMATLIKVATNTWFINGTGVS